MVAIKIFIKMPLLFNNTGFKNNKKQTKNDRGNRYNLPYPLNKVTCDK